MPNQTFHLDEIACLKGKPDQVQSRFDRFWLTENEVRAAERDANWTLCRIWGVDVTPSQEFFGNIVQNESHSWKREPALWTVRDALSWVRHHERFVNAHWQQTTLARRDMSVARAMNTELLKDINEAPAEDTTQRGLFDD